MAAPNGNQNARKEAGEKKETYLHIRCTEDEKGQWISASRPGKLAEWVTKNLNNAAKRRRKK